MAKLNALRQTNTAELFGCEVEKLTEQLKSTYINTGMPPDLATKMATDSGVDTLIKGAKNPNTKLIIQAGTFSTVTDAVQKMLKNDVPPDNTAQMFWNTRGNNSNRFHGGRGMRGNMRNLHSNNQNNSYSNYNRRGRGSYNTRYFHSGNSRFSNNRFQNNGRGRGNGRGGYPMFYAQQMGQSHVPSSQNFPPQSFAIVQAPQSPQISPMLQAPNQNINNIHPLGQPFGQHTQ